MFFRFVVMMLAFLPQVSQSSVENSTYYAVRPDLRMCPSPACGGLFVHRVNRAATRCLDGSLKAECYVVSVELAALNLTPDEEGATQSTIRKGTVLLKGTLRAKTYNAIGSFGEFVASEAWESATDATPSGIFYRATDSGIVCITAPCMSYREFRLNSRIQRNIAGVDLTPVGASDKQLEQAGSAIRTAQGLLVAGSHKPVKGPAGRARGLVASQLYLPVAAGAPKKCFVAGCSLQVCADTPDVITTCQYKPEYACYTTAHCERQADNNCGWTPTPELTKCLDDARAGGSTTVPRIFGQ